MPATKKKKKQQVREFHILLDEKDYEHLVGAMRRRELMGCAHIPPYKKAVLPHGESNRDGALLAEICRGWAEAITGWKWMDGEPMNPDERAKQRKSA